MATFWQYLTVQIVLTERKTSPIPSIAKYTGKEGLKLSKVRRKKWLVQIFRKDLTDRKLERTRMKMMLSVPHLSVFSHKVHNIKFEKRIRILF